MQPTAQLPRHFDATMRSCFVQCPEKFRNEFILGLRPAAVSVDLHAGGCVATAMEVIYKAIHDDGLTFDAAMQQGLAAFLLEWGDFVPMKDTPKTKDRTWEAIENYFEAYPPLTDHIQPQKLPGGAGSEFGFAIPLEPIGPDGFPEHPDGGPFLYAGRLDMFGNWHGKPLGLDHKTTTSVGASWAEKWDLRGQFLGYCWAFQQYGIPVDTIAVRGIGILKTKFHQVEAIKTYSDWQVAKWHEQLRRDLWRLRRAYDTGFFDQDFAEACTAYGGCPFTQLCTSRNPENWYSHYVTKRWDPLKKNPIAMPEAA